MTVSNNPVTTRRGIPDTVAHLRATFRSGRTKPLTWRLNQLAAIERMVNERERDLCDAMMTDLGRPAVEGWLADVAPVASESAHARRKLAKWVKPKRVPVPLAVQPARAWYQYEPKGVVLIIAPWNYPVQLVLAPLVSAVAAGNCAILKPSEHTPTVSATLKRVVAEYLDTDAITVVEGAADVSQQLLDQALDHCFFTGGPETGKAVMAAAAKHLTPVTLELGGKSPVIVAEDARLPVAAKRIAWAKLLNSGQTCVAPDYVLVDRKIRDSFVDELTAAIDDLRGKQDAMLPLVNTRHAERIANLAGSSGGRTVAGGRFDAEHQRGELTVVVDPQSDSALMREEIFGPVLPLVSVDSLDDAIAHVQQGPKPLATYVFTEGRDTERRVLDEISNGATVVNHLMHHVLVNELPFGGVGTSGMGAYHGWWGFETFSHRKAVMRKPTRPDPSIAYPPYTALKRRILRMLF
jgi:aldehyde dehydrogenase (NAD+)